MKIQQKLIELFAQYPVYVVALELLVSSQNDILRFPPLTFFSIPFEGDEVVLTDGMRADIETALGCALQQEPAVGNRGSVEIMRLFAPLEVQTAIKAAIKQFCSDAALPPN
jgi:hypothetical protein